MQEIFLQVYTQNLILFFFSLQRFVREGNHYGESLTPSQKKRKSEVRDDHILHFSQIFKSVANHIVFKCLPGSIPEHRWSCISDKQPIYTLSCLQVISFILNHDKMIVKLSNFIQMSTYICDFMSSWCPF